MQIEWLICLDPVHIGGADSSNRGNSNPVFRLPDRTPVVPGSSLRGALREHAEELETEDGQVTGWFGSKNNESGNDLVPGSIALGWGFPLWWPIHVLGYGTWWVSCRSWLSRFYQLANLGELSLDENTVYVTHPKFKGNGQQSNPQNQSIYLRWLKLENPEYYDPKANLLPCPSAKIKELSQRRIIIPDQYINTLVDMGLIRQPRVSLKTRDEFFEEYYEKLKNSDSENSSKKDKESTLVNNLFSVEGFPPQAVFYFAWTDRIIENSSDKSQSDLRQKQGEAWGDFLHQEHFLGGLWSIGYGRILITSYEKKDNQTSSANGTKTEEKKSVITEEKKPNSTDKKPTSEVKDKPSQQEKPKLIPPNRPK